MLKRNYKDSALSISVLGLGCMRLPKMSPDKEDIDYEKAQEMVDYALANGINYIDTAHMYHDGASEEFVGHDIYITAADNGRQRLMKHITQERFYDIGRYQWECKAKRDH